MFVLALGQLLFALTDGQVIHLVGAVAFFTHLAVHHGIRKATNVTGGGEHCLMGEDGAVHADDVIALLDVFAPPVILEVAFQLGTERAVVPAAVEAAVEFSGLEDESFAFTKRYDFFHSFRVGMSALCHGEGD